MSDLVLVLEDDDDIRAVLADLLREAGFTAVEADHDGILPDVAGVSVVLTDLPSCPHGYSSGEARDWVGAVRDRYLAPVVVITAHSEATSDEALTTMGATVLTKPFEVDDLVQRVAALSASARSGGAR